MKISDMKVGKIYKMQFIDDTYKCLLVHHHRACLVSIQKDTLMMATNGATWEEYVEPVVLNRYAAVIKIKSSGELVIKVDTFSTEEGLRNNIDYNKHFWELIDIIPVTWEEKK